MEEDIVINAEKVLKNEALSREEKAYIVDLLVAYKSFRRQLLSAFDNGFINKERIKNLIKKAEKTRDEFRDRDFDVYMHAWGGIYYLDQLLTEREV